MRKLVKKPVAVEYDIEGCNVFLSGPVTGLDRQDIIRTFNRAEDICYWNLASEVFNPTRSVPKEYAHDEAMLRCLNELTMRNWDDVTTRKPFYDFLIQLDGWEDSSGACAEKAVALACGIEVISIHEVRWD